MRKNQLLSLLFILFVLDANAGDGQYPVSAIPEALLKNAHVIVRYEEERFEVESVSRAKHYQHYVLTILDEIGAEKAFAYASYDKTFWQSPSIDGKLCDANGKKIKSVKNSDISDVSTSSESDLASSFRVRYHNFYWKGYPYTIEYEIEQRLNGTMFFPSWNPMRGYNCAVQSSRMIASYPDDYKLRFKAFNYNDQPVEQTEKGRKTLTWEIKNVSCLEDEFANPEFNEIAPYVLLGPTSFKMEDYSGDMSSWKSFGKFTYDLRAGRETLPDAVKQTVHQLTDEVKDPKEKIRVLYEYMQQNTRYVNVSLGIGGWQPYDATYVATKKYGDCKALSNFMFSLLKEAGIKSFYTLARAGRNERYLCADFPSSQFNHVILSVPMKTDTVWLECTSQIEPAGYLGSFTQDGYVLMVSEEGGALVKTPAYGMKDNLQVRNVKGKVDADGNLSLVSNTMMKGMQQDNLFGLVNSSTREKLLDYLKKEIELPQYDIENFDYQIHKASIPWIDEMLKVKATNYAQVSSRRIFIEPNVLAKMTQRLIHDDTRKFDLVLQSEYCDCDTVQLEVPDGYQPEAMPSPVDIATKFGHYKSACKIEKNQLLYYRSFEKLSGRFPPAAYNELVAFYDDIYRADHAKVVLVKK